MSSHKYQILTIKTTQQLLRARPVLS